MKLGMLTACLPGLTLEQIAAQAALTGFEALEVAAWPDKTARPFTASHIDVTNPDADLVLGILEKYRLELSSLAYYDNNLHPDPHERARIHRHLSKCIEAAAVLNCPTVGTFIGRDPSLSVAENLRLAETIFPPIVEKAEALGVSIVIENCFMEGWHSDGYAGNLAYSPELWEWMFSLGLYLNFDPSHLVWLGINPVVAMRPYGDRILHAQAKDIEVFTDRRDRFGFPGRAVRRDDPWDVGWWRYRVPGLGDIEWPRIVDALYEIGFEGTLSVEYEDPVLGGDEERIYAGLEVAHRTLRPLVVR